MMAKQKIDPMHPENRLKAWEKGASLKELSKKSWFTIWMTMILYFFLGFAVAIIFIKIGGL
jgi:hypothetical protein